MAYTSMQAAVAAGAKATSFDPDDTARPDYKLAAKIADPPKPYNSPPSNLRLPNHTIRDASGRVLLAKDLVGKVVI